VLLLVGSAASAWGQCIPPANSNEAKLMAHYEAPVVFSTAMTPQLLHSGSLVLLGELTGVPAPSASISNTSYCYVSKQEGTHLAPVLPRLRLTVGLPAGFALEGSYLPPITVDNAQPNLLSFALSYTHLLAAPANGPTWLFSGRIDGTSGTITGPITCPSSALQQTQPGQPCYGTQASADEFHPTSIGLDATVGAQTHSGINAFVGTGYSWYSPHFRVGFTNLTGYTDHTLVEINLRRVSVFGGVGVRIIDPLDVAAEVYSVPEDVTTWRVSIRYRVL
jgi:hypothetical protein